MSIKDRLAKKTGDLVARPSSANQEEKSPAGAIAAPVSLDARFPRTAPGQMLAFRSHMQESDKRVDDLQAKLKEFEGGSIVKLLDPKLVSPSKWANRHSTSFEGAEFSLLKDEIAAAGGNVQPIRVRPIGETGRFEIIFGHRRHQACLQLGISVLAMLDSVDDKELFAAMDRENRTRADLSPYEQGEMYRKALDEGLYPSLRQLASELGVDPGNASKCIAIARLPAQVLSAFESPTQIQYRWGQDLSTAVQKDPEGVISRAKDLRFSSKQLPPLEALNRLLGKAKPIKPVNFEFKRKGKVVGRLSRKADGSITLAVNSGVVSEESFGGFKKLVDDYLKA